MEINKKQDKILKSISMLISLVLILGAIVILKKYLVRFAYIPLSIASNGITMLFKWQILILISNLILIILLWKILYLYLNYFLKQIVNKKILKGILLLIPIIVVPVLLLYIKDNVNYLLRNSILLICYILALICAPIIILGENILKDMKHKKIRIVILIILMIFIYAVNFNSVIHFAEVVVQNLSASSIKNLFEKEQTETLDLSYLNSYTQKVARNGYLDMYDIKQILTIVDSKSMKIFINYKDSSNDINLELTNKEDEKITKLKESLESNFYKFNYEVSENNEITVNIERYVIEKNSENIEKNSKIILKGNKNQNLVEKNQNFVDNQSFNYVFDNKMKSAKDFEGADLYSLNLLLVYDEESKNYIPVDIGETNYNLIESYKVYSTGIEIILKPGVNLKKEDYTLRINRYNENLEIPNEKNINYYYKYEPVVDVLTSSKNSTVLDIKFDNTYKLENLKNIEIIF